MSQIPISVIMPVYNGARYLRECLDSILCQTFRNFELLIVDDGSTDDTCDIIRSYSDSRIRLVENHHDYIGSCNLLLKEAKGKYLARMDADDIMMPDRLMVQYEYMEKYPEIDVLGGGMECFGAMDEVYTPFVGDITLHELLDGCCIAHPTSFLRKSSIRKAKLCYRQEFIYAEDYDFWVEAAERGLRLRNVNKVFTKYRISHSQVSCLRHEEQQRVSDTICRRVSSEIVKTTTDGVPCYRIRLTSKRLTAIIAFYNEGDELRQTIKSIRDTAGWNVDVIVIDDCSTDGHDYKHDLKEYDVRFIRNPKRIGAAASKEKGVRLCTTSFFVIFDAHMRFYTRNWCEKILNELMDDECQLLCCQTKILSKVDGEVCEGKEHTAHGAYVYMGLNKLIPSAMWNYTHSSCHLSENAIPCVLGASYASSIKFWRKIRGYEGLLGFGGEEPYISMKAWLAGGRCAILEDVVIGHVYKSESYNFKMYGELTYNSLAMSQMLLPTSLQCRVGAVAKRLDSHAYDKAGILLKSNGKSIKQLRDYYSRNFEMKSLESCLRQSNVLTKEMLTRLNEEYNAKMKDILRLSEKAGTSIHETGIKSGTMCLAILYGLYYKLSGFNVFLTRMQEIIYDIRKRVERDELSMSFDNGALGVGWGLIYLVDMGILSTLDTKDILLRIDRLVSMVNPKVLGEARRIHDFALYSSARLGFCKRHGVGNALNKAMIKLLKEECAKELSKASIKNIEIKQYISISLMSLYNTTSWSTLGTDIQEIMNLPTYIPQDERFWDFGMDGYVGYGINLTATKLKLT